MTPQERQMIHDLFDRLARVETAARDPEAEAAIAEDWQRAPNASYALVQTVLMQEEALKRAHERIEALEARGAPETKPAGSFLDPMRDNMIGQGQGRGSVPYVAPPGDAAGRPAWNTGQVLGQGVGQGVGQAGPDSYPPPQAQAAGRGGSFLGTAAAAAAGVVGGSLLMNSIRSMTGGGQHGFGDASALGGASPWASNPSGGSLARDAGVNDIGSSGSSRRDQFDQAQADADQDQDQDDDDFDDDDDDDSYDDDGDDGGTDYA